MSRLAKVIEDAVPLVLPTPRQSARISVLANWLLQKTAAEAAKHPEARGALLGGSFAKGTWIPSNVDLDIFVRFDVSVAKDRFEALGLAIGAKATRGYPMGKKYAEHPYTEAIVKGTRVNIVPCYDVEAGKWKSAADRSPFHVELVRKASEETKTQIRLLKRFMKAVGVYGAEIEVEGFSGYVAEVLTMAHGDLRGVLEWFSRLRANEDRLLTLPDPVDRRRDLALAVSPEKFGRMVLAAREFLRAPDRTYFMKASGRSRPDIRDSVVAVVFSHVRLSEDTLWGELRRTTRHIVRHLEVNGFKIARSMAASDNAQSSAILIIPEFTCLPDLEQRVGPTVDRRKDVEAFLESGKKSARLVWVDDEARVRFLRPRRRREIRELLGDLVKGKAGPVGASRELEDGMKRGSKVLSGAPLARLARGSPWLDDGLREISTDAIGTRPA